MQFLKVLCIFESMKQEPQAIESFLVKLEESIQQFFEGRKSSLQYGELFDPLYFDICEYVGRKGKRVRPLLFAASYQAFGGDRSLTDSSVLKSGVALELLHSFILIHDDVIDRSSLRRGLPTYHKLVEQRLHRAPESERAHIGASVAIVMGDLVFAMAVDSLRDTDFDPKLKDEALKRFLHYSCVTGVGEVLDVLFASRDVSRVSGDDIRQMYDLKTTLYTFEAPSVMGAVLAGADESQIDALKHAMSPLGLAFQMQNDLMEFRQLERDDAALGTDLEEGKKTLLIRQAFDRLGEVDRSFLQMCMEVKQPGEASLMKVRDLIRKSGAVQSMQEEAESLFAEGVDRLGSEPFTPEQTKNLLGLIESIRQQIKVKV